MVNTRKIVSVCKMARIRHGKTQKQISDESGYTLSSISAFENNQLKNINVFIYYFEKLLNFDERMAFLAAWKPKSMD